MDNCFACGESGHMVRDYPMGKNQGKERNQAQASAISSDAPKKNRYYALKSRSDQEGSHDIVTGMLEVF